MRDFGVSFSVDLEDGEGTIKEYPYETVNKERRAEELYLSDWTQVADCPLSASKKTEWATYRQALRDITSHSNWPNLEEADWPIQPS